MNVRIGLLALSALLLANTFVVASAQRSRRRTSSASSSVKPATPKQENIFGTIDEFMTARRAAKTAVTIEGYCVFGYAPGDGTVKAVMLDSVDRVLNATEADTFGRRGVRITIPASLQKMRTRTAFKPKGFRDFCMYTGRGHAEKMLKDVIAKVRVTGYVASLGAISPVTKVEYMDDNGDWKVL